jgi:hypothetical protein
VVLPLCQGVNVNGIVIEVRRGRDSKLYQVQPLTAPERARARRLAHDLHCRDRLSVRQVQKIMIERYALRRSLGAIHRDLANFACKICEPGNPAFTGG